MKFESCRQCREDSLRFAFAFNAFLAFFKGSLGVLSGSSALVADAFHSTADVVASLVSMVMIRLSNRPPDEEHAFGHGKIQFISSALVGLILLGGSIAILIGGLKSILSGVYDPPNAMALVGAVVSISVNELMYRYQYCVAVENNSPAMMANAWDNRSDAISSVAVLLGIAVAVIGYPIADPICAVGVALVVAKIGWSLNVDAVRGLMDAAADPDDLKAIYRIVKSTPGVLAVSSLRARTVGEGIHAEVSVKVDGELKVYEGDLIVDILQERIKAGVKRDCDVQVFLSPSEE